MGIGNHLPLFAPIPTSFHSLCSSLLFTTKKKVNPETLVFFFYYFVFRLSNGISLPIKTIYYI